MQFRPGETPETAEIQPVGPAPPLVVGGIDADRLQTLFTGRATGKAWFPAGHVLTVDNPRAPDSANTNEPGRSAHDLPDGRAILASGLPGRIEFGTEHRRQDLLLPQSLNLLLAQQWARSGIMMMHAACFEFGGVTTLVVGRKAAGKSILSMAALAAGGRVISDDWLLVALDPGGSAVAERLREFLMLREGWAGTQLRELLVDLPTQSASPRPKHTIALDRVPPDIQTRFPAAATVDQIWRLQRPRAGRSRDTRSEALQQHHALAAIIESTMPLLYGAAFPAERRQLMHTAARLADGTRLRTVETGTDLIEAPRATLERILEI